MVKKKTVRVVKKASASAGKTSKPSKAAKYPIALRDYVRANAENFLARPNINSIGVGYKIKGGKKTKEISIQFTVNKKIALEGLEAIGEPQIPSTIEINGVTYSTDVVQRSYDNNVLAVSLQKKLERAENRKSFSNPVLPGTSVGHPSISAGTVGGVVYDAANGQKYILSNWHVLQGSEGEIGDEIVQPGAHDDNRVNENIVGHLVRSHLGIAGDCAIAALTHRDVSEEMLEVGNKLDSIGEPELDDRVVKSGRTTGVTHGVVTQTDMVVQIDYGTLADPMLVNIGCFEIEPDPRIPARNNEISMGGDSGSCWMHFNAGRATNTMLGLHFAGEVGDAREHALACYPASVFEKLSITPSQKIVPQMAAARSGFSVEFIGENIFMPKPVTAEVKNDTLKVDGESVFHYTHFSLGMSRSRKLARWVAWNIDGGSIRRISRKGISFKKDSRIPFARQLGNEIYKGNPLDRGHIARRADLAWGSMEEARRANKESFFYTNIAPQHEEFNQSSAGGIWGQLENAIFEGVEVHDLKASLIGGPIFTNNDPEFRGSKLPRSYWKVIYYKEAGSELLRGKAFVLTQDDLITGLESLDLPEFSVFEVEINSLQQRIGMDIKNVRRAGVQSISGGATRKPDVRKVSSIREIIV